MKKIILIFGLFILVSCATSKKTIPENSHIKATSGVTKENHIFDFKNLDNGWLQVTESVIIQDITPEEAREKAIERACKNAHEYYRGVEVGSRIVDIKTESQDAILLDNFSFLNQQAQKPIRRKYEKK